VKKVSHNLRQHAESPEHPDERGFPAELEQIDLQHGLVARLTIGLGHRRDGIRHAVGRQELLGKRELRHPSDPTLPGPSANEDARGEEIEERRRCP
jgi:hypothetical protein